MGKSKDEDEKNTLNALRDDDPVAFEHMLKDFLLSEVAEYRSLSETDREIYSENNAEKVMNRLAESVNQFEKQKPLRELVQALAENVDATNTSVDNTIGHEANRDTGGSISLLRVLLQKYWDQNSDAPHDAERLNLLNVAADLLGASGGKSKIIEETKDRLSKFPPERQQEVLNGWLEDVNFELREMIERQFPEISDENVRSSVSAPLPYSGGKANFSKTVVDYLPQSFSKYAELFCGGAKVFFRLSRMFNTKSPMGNLKDWRLNDVSEDLIDFYMTLQVSPTEVFWNILSLDNLYSPWDKEKYEQIKSVFEVVKQINPSHGHIKRLLQDIFAPENQYGIIVRNYGALAEALQYARVLQRPSSNPELSAAIYYLLKKYNYPTSELEYQFAPSLVRGEGDLARFRDLPLFSQRMRDVDLTCGDYRRVWAEIEPEGREWFVFLDSPYTNTITNTKQYHGDAFDFDSYADLCHASDNNICVTIDDSELTRDLFCKGDLFVYQRPEFQFSRDGDNRNVSELIIFNYPITPNSEWETLHEPESR